MSQSTRKKAVPPTLGLPGLSSEFLVQFCEVEIILSAVHILSVFYPVPLLCVSEKCLKNPHCQHLHCHLTVTITTAIAVTVTIATSTTITLYKLNRTWLNPEISLTMEAGMPEG